jgi:hypothetical protein
VTWQLFHFRAIPSFLRGALGSLGAGGLCETEIGVEVRLVEWSSMVLISASRQRLRGPSRAITGLHMQRTLAPREDLYVHKIKEPFFCWP